MFHIPLLMKKPNVTYPGQMVIKNTSQKIQEDWQHAGGKGVGCGLWIFFLSVSLLLPMPSSSKSTI